MRTRIIILMLICLTSSLSILAQDQIAFMGVPIEGPFEDFCDKLVAKKNLIPSYKEVSYEGLMTKSYIGDFWKFTDCEINIRRIVGIPNVSSVAVNTRPGQKFLAKELVNKYDELYGPHKIEDNVLSFEFTWTLPTGNIVVSYWKKYVDYLIIIYSNNEAIEHVKMKTRNVDDDL
ncbi:MAG: hypothetical protein J6X22_02705 [Muribaculaceae bacterium]|nr:hypothetical protein [Muribaculaceae bacterium]